LTAHEIEQVLRKLMLKVCYHFPDNDFNAIEEARVGAPGRTPSLPSSRQAPASLHFGMPGPHSPRFAASGE
jgi:hypothetical protein